MINDSPPGSTWTYEYRNDEHGITAILSLTGGEAMPPPSLDHCVPSGRWIKLRPDWDKKVEAPNDSVDIEITSSQFRFGWICDTHRPKFGLYLYMKNGSTTSSIAAYQISIDHQKQVVTIESERPGMDITLPLNKYDPDFCYPCQLGWLP